MHFSEWQGGGLGAQKEEQGGPGLCLHEAACPSPRPGPTPFVKHILIFKKQSFPAKTNFKGINAQ